MKYVDWEKLKGKIKMGMVGEFFISGLVYGIFKAMRFDAEGCALAYIVALFTMMFFHGRIGYVYMTAVMFWPFYLSKMSVFASYYGIIDKEPVFLRVVSSTVLALVITDILNRISGLIRGNSVCPHKEGE